MVDMYLEVKANGNFPVHVYCKYLETYFSPIHLVVSTEGTQKFRYCGRFSLMLLLAALMEEKMLN